MSIYERAISRHFGLVVLFMIGVAGLAASQLDKVRLDASSDSLLLQGDQIWLFSERQLIVTRATSF